MREKCFVQTKNYSNKRLLPVMKKEFTFIQANLKFLRIFTIKKWLWVPRNAI